ncbi:MAG TPA: short-chain dehydrogenase/reductase, partial [Porphyromonadaceae bacterium]|nr:short-chain dehydrogenase/reductase [Porphyromonadaceae bacterium]HBL34416.1 short-chain dehydrogenase/reductase [Porphyromonadaceae bacterium]
KIINISSSIGLSVDIPLSSVYAMSKFALEGLSEGVYYELKSQNIDIHLVEPGGFRSSLGANAFMIQPGKNSVYGEINECLNTYLESKATDIHCPHTDMEDIVKTVYKLATGEIDSFRNLVGGDAKEILDLRSNNSIEEYLQRIGSRFIR